MFGTSGAHVKRRFRRMLILLLALGLAPLPPVLTGVSASGHDLKRTTARPVWVAGGELGRWSADQIQESVGVPNSGLALAQSLDDTGTLWLVGLLGLALVVKSLRVRMPAALFLAAGSARDQLTARPLRFGTAQVGSSGVPPVRVLLVDGDDGFRRRLHDILNARAGSGISVSEASTGHEALSIAAAQRPDLVLISAQLPGLSGDQVAAAIVRHFPATRIVLIAPSAEIGRMLVALRSGASALLSRDAAPHVVRQSVQAVLRGDNLLLPALIQSRALNRLSLADAWQGDSDASSGILATRLTFRELQVLDCLILGYNNREIADSLGIGDQSARNMVSGVLKKLGIGHRLLALKIAVQNGWADIGMGVETPELPPASRASAAERAERAERANAESGSSAWTGPESEIAEGAEGGSHT